MSELELIPVDKTIYDSLQNIMEGQVRRLALDIVKTLRVEDKPLLQEIRKLKIQTYFFEEENDGTDDIYEMRCKAFEKDGAVYKSCKEPVIYKKEYCPKHLTSHLYTLESIKESEELYLVYDSNKTEYYFDANKNLYDRNLTLIHGKIDEETKKITIYTLSKAI